MTIIDILAAIVSVAVGGFTGAGTVKSHKTNVRIVQSAVDLCLVDNPDGSGAAVAPAAALASFSTTSSTDWYGTNGKTAPALAAGSFSSVVMASLTGVVTTTIGGSVATRGPYLRTSSKSRGSFGRVPSSEAWSAGEAPRAPAAARPTDLGYGHHSGSSARPATLLAISSSSSFSTSSRRRRGVTSW